MHDVFISYSRRDRSRAQSVAKLLQDDNVSVWWDEEIPPGGDYQEHIQVQLENAKCVIVLWSEESVASKWVRSEASLGDERGVLLPIQIAPCRLPVAFRLLQTEALLDPEIDRRSQSWLRILTRVRSLVAGEKPSEDEELPQQAHTAIAQPPQPARRGDAPEPGRKTPTSLFVLIALVLLALWWRSDSLLMATVVVAAAVLFFFRLAEQDISPQMRALAASWMMPGPDKPSISMAEALNHLFEAVFGKSHFSTKCIVRSFAISSLLVFLSLLAVVAAFGRSTELNIGILLTAIIVVFFVNGLGDYICLYKTRVLLKRHQSGWPIFLIALLDMVLGPAIFVALIGLGLFALYWIDSRTGGRALAGAPLFDFWLAKFRQLLLQPYFELSGKPSAEQLPVPGRRLLYSCFATSLVTSLWIWAAVLFGPPLRLLTWLTGGSAVLLSTIFDVQKTPFSALGYFASMIVLLLGCIASGTAEVLAALRK